MDDENYWFAGATSINAYELLHLVHPQSGLMGNQVSVVSGAVLPGRSAVGGLLLVLSVIRIENQTDHRCKSLCLLKETTCHGGMPVS